MVDRHMGGTEKAHAQVFVLRVAAFVMIREVLRRMLVTKPFMLVRTALVTTKRQVYFRKLCDGGSQTM
jgi:hypothetical protein